MGLIRLLYQNKSVILFCLFTYVLFWLTIGTFKQSTELNKTQQSNGLKHRSNSTFYFIFDHLLQLKVNLLLIDPYVLNYLFIEQLSFDKLERQLITFAITDDLVERFIQYFQETIFSIKISENILSTHKTSIDHIFIEYKQKIIHLAILHKYKSFYLIEENILPLYENIQLSYGDTLRAVEPVEVNVHEYSFFYPQNVSHFLWLYQTSKFLHCNRVLADEMEDQFHLYQNASQLNLTVTPMKNIAYGLNELEKHYWLAGGTLLGWYRHCGLIPFTQDADFGLFAEEYDESIRNYFLGNPIAYLWGALGLVNDSLEFRLYTGRFTLDLFWAYREGDHRWCGYQVHRAKFRRTLPLLETLCSCDLFGTRFSIPCSPTSYLDGEYGKDKWKSPLEKNYTWINMKFHSLWNDISWMYAVRLYTRQGKLRTDKFAFDWISNHFNYSITSIPSFFNILPNEPVTLPPLKTKLVYGSPIKKKKSRKKSKSTRKKRFI
ncbi:unnamed protein product [Rotaria sordida]|uniref:LicD/FKTN/FKRP nucleotidyltransferase domain-containing protein n=1 Tax=Rotaria sordida TaxID=392033 RepID=A0A818TL22_9BILA|nr:unnamed protein product [Rotaria sordida]CAF3679189.1 unnamed protein product [Rotaria sordida]